MWNVYKYAPIVTIHRHHIYRGWICRWVSFFLQVGQHRWVVMDALIQGSQNTWPHTVEINCLPLLCICFLLSIQIGQLISCLGDLKESLALKDSFPASSKDRGRGKAWYFHFLWQIGEGFLGRQTCGFSFLFVLLLKHQDYFKDGTFLSKHHVEEFWVMDSARVCGINLSYHFL